LARRVFLEKKRFGSQWFRFAFMESYRIDIAAKKMTMEFLEHGIYQLQQMFMQQSYDVIYTFHSQSASFQPYIDTMIASKESRASGDILCRTDFFQYNNSNSSVISFENTKPNLGYYCYFLKDKKRIAEAGEGVFNQSSHSLKDEYILRAKTPMKCFQISDLNVI